ncbi:MAG: hypothetical protein M3071_07915 [Actinomycetota bacterium]|nr:hypothetical protein [Actinomycetota bacterium]
MSRRRFPSPRHLIGVTRFSDDRRMRRPIELVKLLDRLHEVKGLEALLATLVQKTTFARGEGRPRMPASWVHAYLGHVADGEPHWLRWYDDSTDAYWTACGFAARPSYTTVYQRFRELEDAVDAVDDAHGEIVRFARRHDPLVGLYGHVDATEVAAHVRLVHACEAGDNCPGFRRGRGPTNKPRRVDAGEAAALRAREVDHAPDDDIVDVDGPFERDAGEFQFARDGRVRVKIGAHWYLTRDPDVGIRVYSRGGVAHKVWIGYYNQTIVDHRTGATLAQTFQSASRNEADIYPETLEQLHRKMGCLPRACTSDKGLAQKSLFTLNNRRGVLLAAPLRNNQFSPIDTDTLVVDRDGVPRCKYCGAQGRQIRYTEKPNPRIWFVCTLQLTPGCSRTSSDGERIPRPQSLACSIDPRRLGPLPRTSLAYQELLASHSNSEHAHYDRRRRFSVAGKDLTCRLKRPGLPVQRLRGAAGALIEWVLIAHRCGWLGHLSQPRQFNEGNYTANAENRLAKLRARRRAAGLDLPYGPRAAELGVGPALPPSQRKP